MRDPTAGSAATTPVAPAPAAIPAAPPAAQPPAPSGTEADGVDADWWVEYTARLRTIAENT